MTRQRKGTTHHKAAKETLTLPPPIPDTLKNIARACMQGPPKKEWRYLKHQKKAS